MLVAYWAGAAAGSDCSGSWLNPVFYYSQLNGLRNSPWSWISPETGALLREAQMEWLGVAATVVATPLVWKVGGPAMALQVVDFFGQRSAAIFAPGAAFPVQAAALFAICIFGAATYFTLVHVTGAQSLDLVLRRFRRRG